MKYLCLIYADEKAVDALPPGEMDAIAESCVQHTHELAKAGQYLAGERLASPRTASTVRVRNGQVAVTDGPFAETKEQLGGFYLIEARDLNDAIRIASHIPPARIGSVEVRPVQA